MAPSAAVALNTAVDDTQNAERSKYQTPFMITMWLYLAVVAICAYQGSTYKKAEDPNPAPQKDAPAIVEPVQNQESTTRHEICAILAKPAAGGLVAYVPNCGPEGKKSKITFPKGLQEDPNNYVVTVEVTRGEITSLCEGILVPKNVTFGPGETRKLVGGVDDDCQIIPQNNKRNLTEDAN